MAFLVDMIEQRENFGKMGKASNAGVSWTTNPKFIHYIEASEVCNEDVAFIGAQTVRYFRKKLLLNLSTIEKFHVKKITQDTIERFNYAFSDFPLSSRDFSRDIWQKHFCNECVILPQKMYIEVVQRMIFEVYGVPIEINGDFGVNIPPCDLDYLSRLQHRYNNPFISEDYDK